LEKACPPGHVLIDRYTFEGVSMFVEARKMRDVPTKDVSDLDKERQLEALHEKLGVNPNEAGTYFEIGRVHMELNEVHEAFYYFERALKLDPTNTAVKVAYAETGLKVKEAETISVKGKRMRIEAYEVTGLKSPLDNRAKVPQAVYDGFHAVVEQLHIPDDLILPVEALDSSIGHAKTVALLAAALSAELRVSDLDKQDIVDAAYVADIGKQAIPHHLLNRRGSLSTGELELVKMHSVEGSKILRNMGYDKEAMLNIVLHSHENYDGGGYPDGLKGNAIPLGARIVAVADAYDALTSWRPYRDPWERNAALDELRRQAQRGVYDPDVVQALARILS
jgi:HD-GYP domain-containing protein (c-di-GMP phosphodiesterase class II)